MMLKDILAQVKVIGFDLDDTLWDNSQVIEAAIAEQFHCILSYLPDANLVELKQQYQQNVSLLLSDDSTRYEDVALLRSSALKLLCQHYGLKQEVAEQAFRIFVKKRQEVQLFEGCIDLLERLKSHYTLVAISNGNANLTTIGIRHYFQYHWCAGIDGRAKPHPDMLIKMCQKLAVSPMQMLYIGDKVSMDYAAAKAASCYGVVISQQQIAEDILSFPSLNAFYLEVKSVI